MSIENLILKLNPEQRKAVSLGDGPAVVFAGAGSGKTRIITTRIAKLVSEGVRPSEILAVTFTNKAANEMKERILSMCPLATAVQVGTFHAICARWLREFASELGFGYDFLIYDDADSKSTLKKILKDISPQSEIAALTDEMKYFINQVKTKGLLPHDLEQNQQLYSYLTPPGGLAVYKQYQEYLAACNAMDFNDLLLNILLLLRNNIEVRSKLQSRYKYLLVDEYQDTNQTQFEILSFLAAKHQNIFVVGDDDQSIYSWRGATPGNILDFHNHFEDTQTIKLEQNYRSTKNIVTAASQMIQNNKNRSEKRLWTENEAGSKIDYFIESDGEMEAWNIVDSIQSEKKTFAFKDVAIFYRTNSQSRTIEDSLRSENIPYRIYGGTRFYDRLEIKDIVAYLRLAINPKDDVSLRRIINVPPRKIGKKTLEELELIAKKNQSSLLESIDLALQENPKKYQKISEFFALITQLQNHDSTKLDKMVEALLDKIGYLDYLESKFSLQYDEKLSNIHELIVALSDYCSNHESPTLLDWLQSVTLNSTDEENASGISLMTLHMAKGLEFNRVYIIGVEDGLIPHSNNLDDNDLLEEERRLFYVGMTRAMNKLSLYSTFRRKSFGGWVANPPSRFLKEIPKEFLKANAETIDYLYGSEQITSNNLDEEIYEYDNNNEIEIGDKVFHPTYGKGKIQEVYIQLTDPKALVDFNDFGKRKVPIRHLSTF